MQGYSLKYGLLTAMALFASVSLGLAQRTAGQNMQNQNMQNQGAQEETQGTYQQLQGKIINQKEVAVQGGSNATEKIVLVETQDGQRIAVDLGPSASFKAQISIGAPVTILGDVVQVGGQPVFMSSQIDVGGQSYTIDRPLPQALQQGGTPGQAAAPRQFTIAGTIDNTQEVDVRGSGEKNRVALIITDQGKRILVDLGPVSQLQSVPLGKGERISVTGHGVRTRDRSILFADKMQSGSQSVQINRPNWRGQQTGEQSAPGQRPMR